MKRIAFLTCALALTSLAARAENWPCFRGPTRQGLSTAADLPVQWDASKGVKWKVEIPGEAHSSPIVWGDRIFLTTATDGGAACHVLCVSAADGRVLWNTEVFRQETARKEARNSYATPTPVTDGRRVYALFGSGGIAAVDFDGKVAWTFREFRYYSRHGLGASPLLEDGLLVAPWDWSTDPDKEGADKERNGWQIPWDRSFVFALNAADGKLAWKTLRGLSRVAHITPNLWTDSAGRKQLVSGAGDVLQGFDLKTGELLWTANNPGEGVTPSVVIADGVAIQPNGFGGANSVRAFKLQGAKGTLPAESLLWEQDKNAPKIPSLIYAAPHVLCVTENGMAWCAVAATGKLVWRERLAGSYSASPILAGGKIYITADDGVTSVLAAGEKFEVLARNPLGENVQASPAVWQNCLLLRGAKNLYCLSK
jgi:outer membrane protein assembly factor BamB